MSTSDKPIIFLAFANDKQDTGAGYLRGLTTECNGIRAALKPAEDAGLCHVHYETDVSIEKIFSIFQDPKYSDRIALFHYGGHADSYELLLETESGATSTAHSEGLVSFLSNQKGLKMVFLNGCSSQKQSEDLVKAGLKTVVGTSKAINDDIATALSLRFYKGLANGIPVTRAWKEATDQIKTEKGIANTRGLYYRKEEPVESTAPFPWEMYFADEGAEASEWNLPLAAGNPLFGLELNRAYRRKFPVQPFVGLRSYRREEAQVFFGRGHEIRNLYEHLDGVQPVILFTGKAGVGKTSLLEAGLIPRIDDKFRVVYACVDPAGMMETLRKEVRSLASELGINPLLPAGNSEMEEKVTNLRENIAKTGPGFARELLENELHKLTAPVLSDLDIQGYWRLLEEKSGQPLLLIVDQLEDIFGPLQQGENTEDWHQFVDLLNQIFDEKNEPPKGKIILSYRVGHHQTIAASLASGNISTQEIYLSELSYDGMVNAVAGLADNVETRNNYRVEIERTPDNDLPKIIADDLYEGEKSLLVPVLQVIVMALWQSAVQQNARAPLMTVEMYHELKQSGKIMGGFLFQQLDKIRNWNADVYHNGFLLDFLYRHTTSMGNANHVPMEVLKLKYCDREELFLRVWEKCEDLYLVSEHFPGKSSLSHNFLAPVVIKEYSVSLRPGQQGARILQGKMSEQRESMEEAAANQEAQSANEKAKKNREKVVLDDADLAMVEKARSGMRCLDSDEEALILESKKAKAIRDSARKRNYLIRAVLAACIAAFAVVAAIFGVISERNFKQSRSGQMAYIAQKVLRFDPTKALRIVDEAYGILGVNSSGTVTQMLSDIFHEQAKRPMYAARFDHTKAVNTAVFSPDGQGVLTASEDGWAKLWNLSGELRQSFFHVVEVREAVFSADGSQVLCRTADSVMLWNMDGKRLDAKPLPQDRPASLSYFQTNGLSLLDLSSQPKGSFQVLKDSLESVENFLVFTAADKSEMVIIDVNDSASVINTQGDFLAKNFAANVTFAAFSPNSQYFITASKQGAGSLIQVWTKQAALIRSFIYEGEVVSATISESGKNILTASKDHSSRLWDFTDPVLFRLKKQPEGVVAAFFLPEKRILTTTFNDYTLRVWNSSNTVLDSVVLEGYVKTTSLSPDSTTVGCVFLAGGACLWRPGWAKSISLIESAEATDMAFSPASDKVATLSPDGYCRIYNLKGDLLRSEFFPAELSRLAFSPNGKDLAVAYADSLAILELTSKKIIRLGITDTLKGFQEITSICFSPQDAHVLLSAASSGDVRLWDLNSRKSLILPHQEAIYQVAFSPDGKKLVTAGSQLKIWSLKGQLLDSIAHAGSIAYVAFSPDGKYLLSKLSSMEDRKARLWKLNGTLVAVYASTEGAQNTCRFSADGQKVILCSEGGETRIYYTPRYIDTWMRTAPLYRLTPGDNELYKVEL